jgi:uncharacterized protein YaiI (UPF0178 family)
MLCRGDLVITGDIPLADRVIQKNGHALDHRGKMFTKDNIKQILAVRDLMQTLRDSGQVTGGPAAITGKDSRQFANSLDRFLTKNSAS